MPGAQVKTHRDAGAPDARLGMQYKLTKDIQVYFSDKNY